MYTPHPPPPFFPFWDITFQSTLSNFTNTHNKCRTLLGKKLQCSGWLQGGREWWAQAFDGWWSFVGGLAGLGLIQGIARPHSKGRNVPFCFSEHFWKCRSFCFCAPMGRSGALGFFLRVFQHSNFGGKKAWLHFIASFSQSFPGTDASSSTWQVVLLFDFVGTKFVSLL